MAGAGRPRSVAAAAAATLIALLPLPASASEPEVILGTGVLAVAVDDLDDDGAREVIALLATEREPVALEAWTHGDGAWRSLGRLPVPVVGVAGRSRVSAHLDGLGMVTVRDGGRRETLLFVAPDAVEGVSGAMSMHAVELHDGHLALRTVGDRLGSIEQVYPVDVDGDGHDELVAFETRGIVEREVGVALLRRTGSGWTSASLTLPDVPGDTYLSSFADTDGVPGSEIFLAGGSDGRTWRVAVDIDGSTYVDPLLPEETPAGAWPAEGLWVAGSVGGRALVSGGGAEVATASWERGTLPRIERQLETDGLGLPPFVIGTGEHERVVLVGASGFGHGPIRVLDRDLVHEVARAEPDPIADAASELLSAGAWTDDLSMIYPQLGPIAYGLDGGVPAVSLAGTVIWVAADGRLEMQPARPLLGANVVGSVGPGDDWLALASGWPIIGNAFLRPMGGTGEARLTVVPRDAVIGEAARSDDAGIAIDRLDGHDLLDADGSTRVASGADGFHVRVTGPAGSLVLLGVGSQVQTLHVEDQPLEVTVRPPGTSRGDRAYGATLIVVAPSGAARHESWDALAVREEPELTATAATVDGELAAVVRGRVEQTGGAVMVDGRAIDVAADGSFEVRVDAPPWPRGVDIVSRDILGVEARVRLEVLGLVDYRGWPWAALVAGLTVGAGLVLYVRVPGRDRRSPDRSDDAELEEILVD